MPQEKIVTAAVSAIIFNEAGEILLQKRKDVGRWCIISGHVEFGESIEQAILREVYEETRAQAEIVRFIGVYSLPQYQVYDSPEKSTQYVTTYFEVRLLGPIAVETPNDETLALQFFNIKALPQEMAQINPNWLGDALDKNAAVFVR